jgi:hypothetical protein
VTLDARNPTFYCFVLKAPMVEAAKNFAQALTCVKLLVEARAEVKTKVALGDVLGYWKQSSTQKNRNI